MANSQSDVMKALVFDGNSARVVARDVPAISPKHALVKMTRAGVCNTDLELAKGYLNFRGVLGHELLGVVAVGPDAWRGKRVVVEINFACGACAACDAGLGRHCPSRSVMGILGADGAFAEYVSVPIANLHEVPAALSDDQAVFAEPLAAAFEITEQVPIRKDARSVVLGDGKLGFLVAQVLARAGASVVVVGKHEDKLESLSALGIETALTSAWSADDANADIVVDATGSARGLEAAIRATRPRGTLVLKSTVAGSVTLDLAPVVVKEITVVGSRCGPFAPALHALAVGEIDVTKLVSARFPLERADEALAHAATKGVRKVLIENG